MATPDPRGNSRAAFRPLGAMPGAVSERSERYKGRSLRRPAEPPHAPAGGTYPRLAGSPVAGTPPRVGGHVALLPWSARLSLAVGMALIVCLGLRLPGLFVPPVDAPTGVQATHAAFARVLAGRTAGAPAAPQSPLLTQPWVGPAPANPTAGLPLFDWLAANLIRLPGAGDWVGRLLAVLCSALAGLALCVVVRRSAGALAGVYAMLFFAVSPLSVELGRQFSPSSLLLAAQAFAVLTLLRWHSSLRSGGGGLRASLPALACGALAGLLDAGSLFLLLPAAYLILSPGSPAPGARGSRPAAQGGRSVWGDSPHKGKFLAYAACTLGASLGWWLYSSRAEGLLLGPTDGGGGIGGVAASLLTGGTYVQIVGLTIGKALTALGLLLMGAGLLHGARHQARSLFGVWLAAGLLHILLDAGRLGGHSDALLPLLLPACALVGIGASWAGSLPARIWLAMTEPGHEPAGLYTVSPPTAWLLDLPEIRADEVHTGRPQARPALKRSVAARSRDAGERARQVSLVGLGHVVVLGAVFLVTLSGWQTAYAASQPTSGSIELAQAGAETAALTDPTAPLIIVGGGAPELFYAGGRTGWALTEDNFSMLQVQTLQQQGAAYLLSADQEWLGRQPDYMGLLANYSVKKLGRNYILFDLNTKPTAADRLYFLESGHTLGGAFRRYWETNGGVAKLGYPLSEELLEANPLDGQAYTVQYFERAALELHPESENKKDLVMRAAVGLWVTQGRDFARVAPFKTTKDRAYFKETGHSVKEAFLRYWQQQGGLAAFGYPISEELPEISGADGKVYTVQYFERARFEWHPSAAGTPDEVQLGLIGKQALEMRR